FVFLLRFSRVVADRPAAGLSESPVTSVSLGGKENTFEQKSLSDMQIARLSLFGVNDKNAGGVPIFTEFHANDSEHHLAYIEVQIRMLTATGAPQCKPKAA